ncbi:MAG: translation initiation factor 1 [Thermoproteota archaeon]|nr:translation initiation factor 1 [Thermoproteota archaeon]
MAEICPTCGLPKDICVCSTISREQQRIKVHLEMRRWKRPVTIIEGIVDKNIDIGRLTQKLKTLCACGGTSKSNQIMLQGDHRGRMKQFLTELGFPGENIEVA